MEIWNGISLWGQSAVGIKLHMKNNISNFVNTNALPRKFSKERKGESWNLKKKKMQES